MLPTAPLQLRQATAHAVVVSDCSRLQLGEDAVHLPACRALHMAAAEASTAASGDGAGRTQPPGSDSDVEAESRCGWIPLGGPVPSILRVTARLPCRQADAWTDGLEGENAPIALRPRHVQGCLSSVMCQTSA